MSTRISLVLFVYFPCLVSLLPLLIACITKCFVSRVCVAQLLAIIGETFTDAECICGATLKIRSKDKTAKLALWINTRDEDKVDRIGRELRKFTENPRKLYFYVRCLHNIRMSHKNSHPFEVLAFLLFVWLP